MKLLMLKGLPGSGKSTWAKTFVNQNPGWVRVNKDSLRKMMAGYQLGKDEQLILDWRDLLICRSLRKNKNVVVDDTNFHPKHEKRLQELLVIENNQRASDFVEFAVKFFDVPLNDCIKNDLKRPDSVGEKVIRRLWHQYLAPQNSSPWIDSSLPHAIICDLDGTLALHNGRSPYDTEDCDTDLLNETVFNILMKCAVRILFVTGREEKWREKTTAWLKLNFGGFNELWMRPTGDFREDSLIKQEIYDAHIRGHYNVDFVLDDRNRVVDMWRRNGLTCLQVADGDF